MSLSTFFNPKSIAIIGASRDPLKVGGIVVKNIIDSGFGGQILPINPKASEINGLLCYPDVISLPQIPDLAVIAIPAQFVLESLRQINEKGTKNVVVFTAGFKEIGEEGKQIEAEITQFATVNKINLLGPNCLGFVNNANNLNVTFAQALKTLGSLRFISQSGAIASSIFDWCESTGMGFSQFVTLGNKAVLNENHFLQYWLENQDIIPQIPDQKELSDVQPIGMYLESISDGKTFMDIASKLVLKNPIFILKPGKSEAAAKAMQSHTGAIAGQDSVMEQAFAQAGIIRCEGMEDMFDYARAFTWENAPKGPKVAVVSNAGGPAVISADVISQQGLELTQFDEATHNLLLEKLPREASLINPVDVLGDALAIRYRDACEIILQNPQVHALIVILTPQLMTQIEETAQLVSQLSIKYQKPIVCCFIGGSNIAKGEKVLNFHKIPSFIFPERAIKALAAMWRWRQWVDSQINNPNIVAKQNSVIQNNSQNKQSNNLDNSLIENKDNIISFALSQSRATLDSFEANELLKSFGINAPATQQIEIANQARQFINQNGFPAVLKLSSPLLLHKTESGAVLTGLDNFAKLDEAFTLLSKQITKLDETIKPTVKIQIQKQVEKGVEVIVGVKRDPNFGPVLMFGAGGTLAELIADRNLYVLPINQNRAIDLIKKAKVFKLLNGFRGSQAYSLEKLADLIVKLSNLAQADERIAEIEINPVIVTYDQTWAVDGKVVLQNINHK